MTNNLPQEWQGVYLRDVARLVTDKVDMAYLTTRNYISTDNMNNDFGGVTVASKLPDVKFATAFKKGDILFSNIRTYFRKVWQATFDGGCSADVLVFRSTNENEVTNDFIYHILTNREFTDYTVATSKGAKMPRGDKTAMLGYKTITPKNKVACDSITDVLGCLDDKIKNNRKMNETLESMAQAMFKSWFVDFEPTHKLAEFEQGKSPHKTKKSLAQSLYMSEQTLNLFPTTFNSDGLPMGWEEKTIDSFVNIKSGFAFKNNNFIENGNFRLVTIRNVQDGEFLENTKNKLSTVPKKMKDYCKLNTGDILLSLTGNVGRVCFVIGDNYLLNQRVAKLVAKEDFNHFYTYLMFRQSGFIERLENLSSGTAQQNLSPIKTGNIIYPKATEQVEKSFFEIISPILQKTIKNKLETQTLTKIRNTLLPKLISGEIRV